MSDTPLQRELKLVQVHRLALGAFTLAQSLGEPELVEQLARAENTAADRLVDHRAAHGQQHVEERGPAL